MNFPRSNTPVLIVLHGGSLYGLLSMAAAQGWQEIGPAVKRNGVWEVTVR